MQHQHQTNHSGLGDRSSESPLDFSSATNGSYGGGGSGGWQDDVSAMMIDEVLISFWDQKVILFFYKIQIFHVCETF